MKKSSTTFFERALRVIPGGVNSPVRAFQGVGGDPLYVAHGNGARITTVDGRELTDYCCSWGPLILGHARPEVVEAICKAAGQGTTFGINTPGEVELAEWLCAQIPSMQKVRLVSSGTEATMTALRLARGATGRSKIIKFEGGYHGHSDSLLVSAGSGLLTGGISSSAGVSHATAAETFVPPYNDLNAVREIVRRHGDDLAAIIVEPVAGNMGLVPPLPGFLEGLRAAADQCGALLIFDEVISGFRLAPTTYGALCGVAPDLSCLGKIIGGGLPIGAVGGRAQIMDHLAPLGRVYQAGTLSGNPVAVAAGLATLKILKQENPYPRLERFGALLADGVTQAAHKAGIPFHVAYFGGMFTLFFRATPVHNLTDAKGCDTHAFARWFHNMLNNGIYLPPSQFETAFISVAHTEQDIQYFIHKASSAFAEQQA
jgi:glutamate-1-semialdehyde 2,1-aminomutase